MFHQFAWASAKSTPLTSCECWKFHSDTIYNHLLYAPYALIWFHLGLWKHVVHILTNSVIFKIAQIKTLKYSTKWKKLHWIWWRIQKLFPTSGSKVTSEKLSAPILIKVCFTGLRIYGYNSLNFIYIGTTKITSLHGGDMWFHHIQRWKISTKYKSSISTLQNDVFLPTFVLTAGPFQKSHGGILIAEQIFWKVCIFGGV